MVCRGGLVDSKIGAGISEKGGFYWAMDYGFLYFFCCLWVEGFCIAVVLYANSIIHIN